MSFELEGKLIVKGETQEVSEKFKKREFVVQKTDTSGSSEWTEDIKIQFVQKNCDKLDDVNIGDQVKVSFNIQGKGYDKNGKTNYFVNLTAWRIEKQGVDNTSHQAVPQTQSSSNQDDLPF